MIKNFARLFLYLTLFTVSGLQRSKLPRDSRRYL